MILTKDTIYFARPDSDVVVDKIALDEVVSVEKVDNLDKKPIAAAKKVPFNTGGSTHRKGFLGLTDSSENASFAKTKGAFEIRVQSDGISRSYFVRVENIAECSAWLHEIHAKILDSQKFSRNRGQYMVQVVQGATSVANNIYLRSFICCVILVEFVLSILESERVSADREAFSQRLEPVDIFFCTIFGLELLVNILAQWKDWLGYSFFRKGSNWIAVATFVFQLVGILSSEFSYKYLKVLRVVRIFDVGRAFAALASCHMVLKAIRQGETILNVFKLHIDNLTLSPHSRHLRAHNSVSGHIDFLCVCCSPFRGRTRHSFRKLQPGFLHNVSSVHWRWVGPIHHQSHRRHQ